MATVGFQFSRATAYAIARICYHPSVCPSVTRGWIIQQESRAAARKPRDAASVLFRWSSPTTFTTSI